MTGEPVGLQPEDIDHYYGVYVRVTPEADCPHGRGRTTPSVMGVRINCPAGRDCWVVKWDFEK